MSGPVNVQCPCDGAAFVPWFSYPFKQEADCHNCDKFHDLHRRKCLGSDGWPILAYTAAEVARERGVG